MGPLSWPLVPHCSRSPLEEGTAFRVVLGAMALDRCFKPPRVTIWLFKVIPFISVAVAPQRNLSLLCVLGRHLPTSQSNFFPPSHPGTRIEPHPQPPKPCEQQQPALPTTTVFLSGSHWGSPVETPDGLSFTPPLCSYPP